MDVDTAASAIGADELQDVARAVLAAPQAVLTDARMTRLSVINGFGRYRGLFRFEGEATLSGRTRPWSVILKVVRRPPQASEDPADGRYWRREADAYGSELLCGLRGVRPARCHGIRDRDADTFTLWLEDLRDEHAGRWPLERYRLAAEHLGEMSGAHAQEPQHAAPPWLFPTPLAGGAAARFVRSPILEPETWQHPDVRRVLPESMAQEVRAQWEHAAPLRTLLAEMPRVLCHNDAHADNLFSMRLDDGTPQTVALDWELLGLSPIATDITYLVLASMRRFAVDAADADALADAALDGYLRGLERGGWRGDPDVVRLAFTVAIALRVGLVPQILGLILNPQLRAREERAWRRPAEELIARWVEVARFVLDRARLARELAPARAANAESDAS